MGIIYLLGTKFGIDQVKWSRDIERTTPWAEKSGLTLTFGHVTWKSIGIIYLLGATPALSLILIKWRGQKIFKADNTVGWEEWFDLDRWTSDLKSIGIIYSFRATPAPSLVLIKWRGQKIISSDTVGWEEWFDLDLWTCKLKINRDHLLFEDNPCIKFGIDQGKGSKDIKRTTQWAEKSGLRRVVWPWPLNMWPENQ